MSRVCCYLELLLPMKRVAAAAGGELRVESLAAAAGDPCHPG